MQNSPGNPCGLVNLWLFYEDFQFHMKVIGVRFKVHSQMTMAVWRSMRIAAVQSGHWWTVLRDVPTHIYPNFEKSKSTIHVNIYIYMMCLNLATHQMRKTPPTTHLLPLPWGWQRLSHFSHHISWEVDTSAERVLDGSQLRNRSKRRPEVGGDELAAYRGLRGVHERSTGPLKFNMAGLENEALLNYAIIIQGLFDKLLWGSLVANEDFM